MADDGAEVPRGVCCPVCGGTDLRVTKTVRAPGSQIRRYRRCRHCGKNITTIEAPPLILRGLFPQFFNHNST